MEIRNRMQQQPTATVEMDLLGLRQHRADPLRYVRANEPVLTITNKEDRMRYGSDREVVLRLKDSSTDQSAGSASLVLARYAVERPRDVAEAIRVLGDNASVTELVGYIQRLDQPTTRSGREYLLDIAIASEKKFRDEQRATRWGREVAAAQATPLAKRHMPGFQKVF